MKRILWISMMCLLTGISVAQTPKAKSNKTKKQAVKTSLKNSPRTGQATNAPTVLAFTSNYSAKATTNTNSLSDQYTIADPTVRALNARANGSDIKISSSGVVGMPKRAYGFANGHLTLFSSGATSSGTITGTGAVGTGSSLGSIGAYGPAIGLNGKSPYAGSTMWGNATGLILTRADSSVRVAKKKQ